MTNASPYSPWSNWSRWKWRAFYWKSALHAWSVAPVSVLAGPRGDGFGVITYHRVAPSPKNLPRPPLNVTPARFRSQLDGLLRRGYEPWPLRTLIERHGAGAPLPRRAFAVLFDDGFECVYKHAFPVLRELQIPATVFLPTAYLDSQEPFPFDDWPCAGAKAAPVDAWRPLSTDQCREMLASDLIDLGSHTHTHQDFRGRLDDFVDDLRCSLNSLEDRFGLRDVAFAFPFGFLESAFQAAARDLGVSCCLTCDCRLIRPDTSPFNWGRFGAEQFDTATTLAAKLDGWYDAGRSLWSRMRGRRQPAPLVLPEPAEKSIQPAVQELDV